MGRTNGGTVSGMTHRQSRSPGRGAFLLMAALVIIAAGSVVTCITRTRTVAGQLKEAP